MRKNQSAEKGQQYKESQEDAFLGLFKSTFFRYTKNGKL